MEDQERITVEKGHDPSLYTELRLFIEGARCKGAYLLLLAPVNRRLFEDGKIINTHREYCKVMKELALELNVLLMDVCDNTHFSRQGAIEIAKLVIDGIKNDIDLPLKIF
nr:MAG: hypothetical protein DIU64_12110 [Caldicoprobacter oshimai]